MKKLLVAMLMLAPIVAYAQQPPASTEFILKVKPSHLDVIGKGLGELPFKDAVEVMQVLRQQVMEQQQPKVEPKPEPDKGTKP